MSISLLQQTSRGRTYLKKGGEGLSATQKHQNKKTKPETQPSENRTIHDRKTNGTSQLPTKATRINETPTPSISYIVIGTSTAKRSDCGKHQNQRQ